jgi:hypothetical protein
VVYYLAPLHYACRTHPADPKPCMLDPTAPRDPKLATLVRRTAIKLVVQTRIPLKQHPKRRQKRRAAWGASIPISCGTTNTCCQFNHLQCPCLALSNHSAAKCYSIPVANTKASPFRTSLVPFGMQPCTLLHSLGGEGWLHARRSPLTC